MRVSQKPVSEAVKKYVNQESALTLHQSVTAYIVPFAAQWVCNVDNHAKLAKAINAGIKSYQEEILRLRIAAGHFRQILNENFFDDVECVLNNLVVFGWQTFLTFTVSDRSDAIKVARVDATKAKSFFMQLEVICRKSNENRNQDSGWEVKNHNAGFQFFEKINFGRVSLKTTIVAAVLEEIKNSLNVESKEERLVADTFFELDEKLLETPNLAKSVFHEILGAIAALESVPSPLSSTP